MVTERFLLGRGRDAIPADDLQALDEAMGPVRDLPARQVLVRRGQPVRVATLLVDGYVVRYMDDREGHRQIVAIHVPGDFIDLHGFPMHVLDHDIATLGPARVASVDHPRLTDLTEARPQLTRMLWFSTLLDAALHREWIFRLGRLGAEGRVAHFFAELEARLAMVGLSDDGRFPLPMTQADLGEACGITGVHANRVLRALREDSLLSFTGGQAAIIDRPALARLGEFTMEHLYPGGVPR